ncbi:MAG: prepilin-type N-terminal cleavage/methylation domain-containing protein [Polyangiaceae bacterium]
MTTRASAGTRAAQGDGQDRMGHPRTTRRMSRGFTLTELMIVVAIVGVLAALAMVSYRKFVDSSKNAEATHMVQSIRSAEEAYRAETMSYLNVSTSGNFYPQNVAAGSTTFTSKKWSWVQTTPDSNNWKILGVTTDSPVAFGYRVRAGAAGTVPVTPAGNAIGNWPSTAQSEPWYVVEACGNPDQDSTYTYAVSASFAGEIFWTNP